MAEAPQVSHWFRENFSTKAFLQGLAIVLLLYFLLVGWVIYNSEATYQKQQKRLASQTVIVQWPGGVPQENEDVAASVEQLPDTTEAPPLPAIEENMDLGPVDLLESGLAEAPIQGLYEETPDGRLPVARPQEGITPFKAYRRPFNPAAAAGKPVVAIAIAGLGLSDIATDSAIRSMPPEVSFIVSPYAPSPEFWVREARARGHEIWLSLPVEPKSYPMDDPGPHTMLIGAPERENQAKLSWLMGRAEGYVGFVTNYQPAFMDSVNDMRPVVGNIYRRGLGLIDGSDNPGTAAQTMAMGMKAPYGTVDVWIDHPNASQARITEALAQLEAKAHERGVAVGVIHTLPVSYQQVLKWLETLPQKNLVLAPLSATTGH